MYLPEIFNKIILIRYKGVRKENQAVREVNVSFSKMQGNLKVGTGDGKYYTGVQQ